MSEHRSFALSDMALLPSDTDDLESRATIVEKHLLPSDHDKLIQNKKDALPPVTMAEAMQYISVYNYGAIFCGFSALVGGYVEPSSSDYVDYARDIVDKNPVLVAMVSLIILAFGLAHMLIGMKRQLYQYAIGGAVLAQAGMSPLVFRQFGRNGTVAFQLLSLAVNVWLVQSCQVRAFQKMIDNFRKITPNRHLSQKYEEREGRFKNAVPGSELRWVFFGCASKKTQLQKDSEQWGELYGNYRHKDLHSTQDQLIDAYRKALDSSATEAPLSHQDPKDHDCYESVQNPLCVAAFYMEGMLCFLSWMTGLALTGMEFRHLRNGTHETLLHWRLAVCLCTSMVLSFLRNIAIVENMMARARGLHVAEVEWMAIDILEKYTGKNMLERIVKPAGLPAELLHRTQRDFDIPHHASEKERRLNLTYLWLCAAACADGFGAGLVTKLASNCALTTKVMFEKATGNTYEFVGFAQTRWELLIRGKLLNAFQLTLCSLLAIVYFDTYGHNISLEHSLFWGLYILAICVASMVCRVWEAYRLWRDIDEHAYGHNVLMFLIAEMFFLQGFFLTTCLMPMVVKHTDLFGACSWDSWYVNGFKDECQGSHSEVLRWMVACYWILALLAGIWILSRD